MLWFHNVLQCLYFLNLVRFCSKVHNRQFNVRCHSIPCDNMLRFWGKHQLVFNVGYYYSRYVQQCQKMTFKKIATIIFTCVTTSITNAFWIYWENWYVGWRLLLSNCPLGVNVLNWSSWFTAITWHSAHIVMWQQPDLILHSHADANCLDFWLTFGFKVTIIWCLCELLKYTFNKYHNDVFELSRIWFDSNS